MLLSKYISQSRKSYTLYGGFFIVASLFATYHGISTDILFSCENLCSACTLKAERSNVSVMNCIFYILVTVYITTLSHNVLANDANDESDDAKLEQALMMVELLKSEYVKLLSDNIALRAGVDNSIVEPEQSTCAANESTTVAAPAQPIDLQEQNSTRASAQQPEAPSPAPLHGAESALQVGASDFPPQGLAPPVGASDLPPHIGVRTLQQQFRGAAFPSHFGAPGFAPQVGGNAAYGGPFVPIGLTPPNAHSQMYHTPLQPAQNYYRRHVPDYYYYDFRRRFYNEPPMVGKWPRRNFMPTDGIPYQVVTSEAPWKVSQPAPARLSQSPTSLRSLSKAAPNSKRPMQLTSQRPRTSKILRQKKQTQSKTTRLSALRKLRRDGKAESSSMKPNNTNSVNAEVISELMKELGQPKGMGYDSSPDPVSWPAFPYKSTLKIFLEKSTRYPIPFPENHAFCFTNPSNRLCKVPMK